VPEAARYYCRCSPGARGATSRAGSGARAGPGPRHAGCSCARSCSGSRADGEADNLVLIEGNTDERGTAEYNLALGERRAKAAMNYLVAQGIQANRITIISYGKERPVCTESTEACWAQNRRADFLTKTR